MGGQKEKDEKEAQLKRCRVEGDDGEKGSVIDTLEGTKDCLEWNAKPWIPRTRMATCDGGEFHRGLAIRR
jgi:hypothetical protein